MKTLFQSNRKTGKFDETVDTLLGAMSKLLAHIKGESCMTRLLQRIFYSLLFFIGAVTTTVHSLESLPLTTTFSSDGITSQVWNTSYRLGAITTIIAHTDATITIESSLMLEAIAGGHLIIMVDEGCTLTIHLKADFACIGLSDTDFFYIVVGGKGTTQFTFDPGVRFFLKKAIMRCLMQDTASSVKEHNTLLFSRITYQILEESSDKPVSLIFLQKAALEYVSLDDETEGYGAVAFDVSYQGSQPFNLIIAPDDTSNEGGINVYGKKLTSSGVFPTSSELVTPIPLAKRGGHKAYFRLIDDKAYHYHVPDKTDTEKMKQWMKRDATHARGLSIHNYNATMPPLACVYDKTIPYESSTWASSAQVYQAGFVLAENGLLEVGHRTFCLYYALSSNKDVSAQLASSYLPDITKYHNPSALCVDYYDSATMPLPTSSYESAGREASVRLHGASALYFAAGASSATSKPVSVDYTIAYGIYDGSWTPPTRPFQEGAYAFHLDEKYKPLTHDPHEITTHYFTDGEHVIEQWGKLSITSVFGKQGHLPAGKIMLLSIPLDHTGKEKGPVTTLKPIPLLLDTTVYTLPEAFVTGG